MGVHQVRNIELNLPYNKVFNLCIESLNLIKRCEIEEKDSSQGKIIAKVGVNWMTSGDIISFKIHKINDNKSQVEVSSKPRMPTVIIDWGKNLENVETISSFLRENNKGHIKENLIQSIYKLKKEGKNEDEIADYVLSKGYSLEDIEKDHKELKENMFVKKENKSKQVTIEEKKNIIISVIGIIASGAVVYSVYTLFIDIFGFSKGWKIGISIFTFFVAFGFWTAMQNTLGFFEKANKKLSKEIKPTQVNDSPTEKLKKLKELKDAGAITDKEFNSKKKKLLDDI